MSFEIGVTAYSDEFGHPIRNSRTLIRDSRTVVGAWRRSAGTLTRVSELGQVFPAFWGLFFGAEGDEFPWRSGDSRFGERRADRAIPKWGSADRRRSAEPQFAAPVVRLGPIWGWPGLRSTPPRDVVGFNPKDSDWFWIWSLDRAWTRLRV